MKDGILLGPGTLSLVTKFGEIELGSLAFGVAIDVAIKRPDDEQRRYDRITGLMFSQDRRQRKRGFRLWEKK